ncbi:MAG: sulfotransferase domain-containing protein, partial [Paracoccaceae bacterium]
MTRDPRTLVWLASYPTSGNTWLRAFLANYFIDSATPVSINEMQKISFGDSSAPAYAELGRCDPRRLDPARLAALRERHLERVSRNGEVNFVKTHNAHIRIAGRWLIPARLTRAAVYLIRDPRDMVLSYADHFALDPSRAADAIGSAHNRVPANARTVTQFLGDWSGHVKSWTRARDFPVLVLRYEDLL